MNLEIKITGSGTAEAIAQALKQIAAGLEVGDHINGISENGQCNWEDDVLYTNIKEVE